jgi:IS30 family transposase
MRQQLTKEERDRISQLHAQGLGAAAIGRALDRHRSTISRERKRNSTGREYLPHAAHELALERRRRRPRIRKLDRDDVNSYVRKRLARFWSPAQIAGRMRCESPHDRRRRVSRMTIYRWIATSPDRRHWEACLRFGKRRATPETHGQIKARADISGRPEVVDERRRFGDWEGDTVVGAQRRGGVVTLVERKSGFALAGQVKRLLAKNVRASFVRLTRVLPYGLKRTMTLDNGKEFAEAPGDEPPDGVRRVLRTSVPCLGAGQQRELQPSAASVLPEENGLGRCGAESATPRP